jgi:hypothetical protein
MSADNAIALRRLWMVFANFYNEPMLPERVNVFASVMAEFEAADVERAMKILMANPDITRMPLPAKVMQEIRPTLSTADAAQQLLLKVQEAVNLFGYYQPAKAREHIGELCWKALNGQWGWEEFCSVKEGDVGTARAQLRERLKSLLASEAPGGRLSSLGTAKLQEMIAKPMPSDPNPEQLEMARQRSLVMLRDLDARLAGDAPKPPSP